MTDDPERLLAVQELDTAADVLRHRRDTLPERAELEAHQAALAAIEAEAAPVREQRHAVARAQQAIEDEIASLAAKADATNATMYGGSVTNPRELQSLQQELDALARRRAELEDQVLERMVEAEPLDAELDGLAAQRAAALDGLDADLLARYEKLRSRLRGVGIARLDGTRCTGCHLALPAAEVEQVRRQARAEGVATCPECDRLLVV